MSSLDRTLRILFRFVSFTNCSRTALSDVLQLRHRERSDDIPFHIQRTMDDIVGVRQRGLLEIRRDKKDQLVRARQLHRLPAALFNDGGVSVDQGAVRPCEGSRWI